MKIRKYISEIKIKSQSQASRLCVRYSKKKIEITVTIGIKREWIKNLAYINFLIKTGSKNLFVFRQKVCSGICVEGIIKSYDIYAIIAFLRDFESVFLKNIEKSFFSDSEFFFFCKCLIMFALSFRKFFWDKYLDMDM